MPGIFRIIIIPEILTISTIPKILTIMSDIDFISNNNNKEDEKSKSNRKRKFMPKVKWTEPKGGKPAVIGGKNNQHAGADIKKSAKEDGKIVEDKSRLKKSRKEILDTIKKEKGKINEKEDTGEKPGIFGWLSGLKWNSGKAAKGNGIKKDKEILADHKEEVNKEKNKRKAGNEFTLSNPATSKNKKIGISNTKNIIKEKFFKKNKWKAQKILTTNLVKDEVTTFFDSKKNFKFLLKNVLYVCLAVIVIYAGLIFWEIRAARQREFVVGKIEDIKLDIIKIESDIKVVNIFQKKLELANSLLEKHIYWTNFFKFLEENTLTNVYYTSGFSGDTKGKYSFSAQTDSFSSIADQIMALRLNEKILTASADGGQLAISKVEDKDTESNAQSSHVSFQLQMSIDKDVFFK